MEEEQNVQRVSEESISGAAEDPAPETVPETDSASAEAPAGEDGNEELRRELDETRAKREQLERERFLLLQGVPEEDLDYCVFRIGKMVTDGKDFRTAAKEFLKRHETGAGVPGFRTGASLSGRSPKTPPTANETMNQLLRASR